MDIVRRGDLRLDALQRLTPAHGQHDRGAGLCQPPTIASPSPGSRR